jgi:hypothetical protein
MSRASIRQAAEQLRRSWLHWLGYKFRQGDEYNEFCDLLAPEYNEWAQGVLGREKMWWPCLEPTKDYFSEAIRAASLAQLQDLIAVRYIYEHPVADGWTQAYRATLCQPQAIDKPRLIAR